MDTDLLDADVLMENPPVQAPRLKPRYSVDEYLALERAALERHVFLDGEVIAMAGESMAHSDISINIVVALGNQLDNSDCRVCTKDMKVRSGPVPESGKGTKGLYSYPDIAVLCGEPEFHDGFRDIVLNPKVIIEVLSDSTEAFDRGEKFKRYQMHNPTLHDYILVSPNMPQVEHFERQADGGWTYHLYAGLDTNFTIASIGCVLQLASIYRRISLDGHNVE